MSITKFPEVRLYMDCTFQIDIDTQKTYCEEELHKPLFPQASSIMTPVPDLLGNYRSFTDAIPRKGHELDELEVNLASEYFDKLLIRSRPNYKLICL